MGDELKNTRLTMRFIACAPLVITEMDEEKMHFFENTHRRDGSILVLFNGTRGETQVPEPLRREYSRLVIGDESDVEANYGRFRVTIGEDGLHIVPWHAVFFMGSIDASRGKSWPSGAPPRFAKFIEHVKGGHSRSAN